MLFRILKIRKDSRSRQSDAQADDHDAAEDLAEYSGVDNNNITVSQFSSTFDILYYWL